MQVKKAEGGKFTNLPQQLIGGLGATLPVINVCLDPDK